MRRIIAVVGLVGAIAMVVGFATEPQQAAFSYLTAWAFAMSIAIGALVFLMIGIAAEARWAIPFQPITESIVRTLPVLAVLFVPIAIASGYLYPWTDPSPALEPELAAKVAHRAPYLNLVGWTIRAAIFLVGWSVIAEILVRKRERARALAAAMFPVIALTLTFATIDWLMSLTPEWYSTIFGLLYWSGGFVAAMSAVALVARAAPAPSGAIGRMMFAFLIFWGYMEFSQGIIIWLANKPDEVPWYVARGAAHWSAVFEVIVVGHFFIPFFALLSRPLKRRARVLAIVGGWLVVMHYVDIYWMVMPVLHAQLSPHWLDLAAPCAVLGIVITVALARRRPPISDDALARAATYEGS